MAFVVAQAKPRFVLKSEPEAAFSN